MDEDPNLPVSQGPAGEFMSVPTVGLLSEYPEARQPVHRKTYRTTVGNEKEHLVTRPWEPHEYMLIDGVPYQYSYSRAMGMVLHFPGGQSCPLIDLPTRYGRFRKIESPLVLRLSAHPIQDDDPKLR